MDCKIPDCTDKRDHCHCGRNLRPALCEDCYESRIATLERNAKAYRQVCKKQIDDAKEVNERLEWELKEKGDVLRYAEAVEQGHDRLQAKVKRHDLEMKHACLNIEKSDTISGTLQRKVERLMQAIKDQGALNEKAMADSAHVAALLHAEHQAEVERLRAQVAYLNDKSAPGALEKWEALAAERTTKNDPYPRERLVWTPPGAEPKRTTRK